MKILIDRGYGEYYIFVKGEYYTEKSLGLNLKYRPKGYTQDDLTAEELQYIIDGVARIDDIRKKRAKLREGVPALLVNKIKNWLKHKDVRSVFVNAWGTMDYEVCKSVEDFVNFYTNGRYWKDDRTIRFEPMFHDVKYHINQVYGEGIDYGDKVDFYDEFNIEWR